jgi:ATP-binding cassette subfamily F protein 3
MVQLDSVSKTFGADTLFDDIDWQLPEGASVGLVGPNGAGKTTLVEIIAGRLDADTGEVIVPNAVDVGYLPQEVTEERVDKTLLEIILEGAGELLEMQERLDELEDQLERASSDESVDLSSEYAELQQNFQQRGGGGIESRAREIAVGLGFDNDEFDSPLGTFSGGWRMRALLGRLLMRAPEVLLLDEPTNHLDLESLEWLEGFLTNYDGTVVTISHDRYFLNRLVDEIAELAHGTLRVFTGDYDTYREKRRKMRQRLLEKRRQQEKERDEIQEFIDKFRYNASKASLVQSRIKKLEKMELVEVPEPLTTDVSFEFPQPPRVGKTVVQARDVEKSYGRTEVYDGVDFTMYRGEKIAFVGPNGAGKSTLMKMLAGVESPDSGTIDTGNRVEVGYFAQHSLEQIDPNDTVFESMEEVASHDAYPEIRPVLGAFGFSGDDVEKSVHVLSGGEKARLALARMLLEPAGCLLLDEPTNHLDIPSCQVLEQALQDFEGAVGIISHDRYFLNNVVNKVVHVEQGELTNYAGDYDYYRYKRAADEESEQADATADEQAEDEESEEEGGTVSKKERRRIRAELRRERREETEALREEIDAIEERIEEIEDRQETLEEKLADPSTYGSDEDLEELNKEFGQLDDELAELMMEWEQKGAELEEIREEYEKRAEEMCQS